MERDTAEYACAEAPHRSTRVELRRVGELKPRRRNPRTHSAKQVRQIADSIEEFGFTNPILIESDDTVVAGHGRLAAAKRMGLERVPVVCLDHLSPEQARAYVIADNKLAENAGWDRDLLSLELQELAEIDLDFDLGVLGFETPELDLLLGGSDQSDQADPADADSGLADPEAPAVSVPGDLWQIGPHRLLCADALNETSYEHLLGDWRAALVFVDPPYNVPINGHVSGHGRVRHDEFAMASGEMTEAEFTAFLEDALALHARFSRDGAVHFVCMDWRHSTELLAASRSVYSECKNLCVWVKTNAGMGSLYRSQHELIYAFKVGTAPHVNNVELGRHGRNRTNVWRYAGANAFGSERDEALAMHPTVKPVRLVSDAILDCSHRGDVVLDGFCGSGTTLLAAERTGRVGCGLELEPRYVDATIRRMAEHTGLEAVHVSTGGSFEELARSREAPSESAGSPTPHSTEEGE